MANHATTIDDEPERTTSPFTSGAEHGLLPDLPIEQSLREFLHQSQQDL